MNRLITEIKMFSKYNYSRRKEFDAFVHQISEPFFNTASQILRGNTSAIHFIFSDNEEEKFSINPELATFYCTHNFENFWLLSKKSKRLYLLDFITNKLIQKSENLGYNIDKIQQINQQIKLDDFVWKGIIATINEGKEECGWLEYMYSDQKNVIEIFFRNKTANNISIRLCDVNARASSLDKIYDKYIWIGDEFIVIFPDPHYDFTITVNAITNKVKVDGEIPYWVFT